MPRRQTRLGRSRGLAPVDATDPEAQQIKCKDSASAPITSASAENTLNLFSFYFFYLLLVASAVVTVLYACRPRSEFIQTFDVQPFPGVIYAWNRDPNNLALPNNSSNDPSQGDNADFASATCTPYGFDKGATLTHKCSSIAADGREDLRFYLFTATPYPGSSTYRPLTDRFPDITIMSYFVNYRTYLPPTSTSSSLATPNLAVRAASVASEAASATPLAPSRTVSPAQVVATASLPAASLHARQASSIASSATSATPAPSSSLPLRTAEYPALSMTALQRGTIVSVMPTPRPTTTSINASSAKMKQSFMYFFSAVSVVPAFFATLTFIGVHYNLFVATRRVRRARRALDAGQTAMQEVQRAVEKLDDSKPKRKRKAKRTERAAPASEAVEVMTAAGAPNERRTSITSSAMLPSYHYAQAGRRRFSLDGASERSNGRTIVGGEAAPPTYEEAAASTAPQSRRGVGHAARDEEDAIEEEVDVAPELGTDSDESGLWLSSAGPDLALRDPGAATRRAMQAPQKADRVSSSWKVGWKVLPIYAYMFWWDVVAFGVFAILEIAAVSLVGDAMLHLGQFVHNGGCVADPSSANYDLHRSVCGGGRLLDSLPQDYLSTTPRTTITRFGGDLLVLQCSLFVLFVANVGWIVTLFRKSVLTERDGMEPSARPSDRYHTGRSGLGYLMVLTKPGSHERYRENTVPDDVYILNDAHRRRQPTRFAYEYHRHT